MLIRISILFSTPTSRLGINTMQDAQDFVNQIQGTGTAYLCIRVDKNSTKKICKYWNKEELRPVLGNILEQDNELKNFFRQFIKDSFNKGFNKSQSQNMFNYSDKIK
jgi:hypothetical protein